MITIIFLSFPNSSAGGSMLGDVNISAILDSFSVSYDKRVRPNYGGKNHLNTHLIQLTEQYLKCSVSKLKRNKIQTHTHTILSS